MSNTISVLTFVATEMLRSFKNNLQFVKNCDGEDFTSRFTEMPKVGTSFTIRKQAMFTGRTGETYSAENYTERTVSVSVQTTDGLDLTLTNRELMFNLDKIRERVINPAALKLGHIVDGKALQLAARATANSVGTPGSTPTALKLYNQARAKMVWQSCPGSGHTLLITPDMNVEAVDAGKGLFNPTQMISDGQENGLLSGKHYGAKVYEIQNPYTHTVGPLGGTPLVNGASQSGASLITDGWTAAAASRVKEGDRFTIADVYAVNPFTGNSTSTLKEFVITADGSSDGSGNLTLAISPSIVLTGALKNVNSTPADNAAISIVGNASVVSPEGLRFQRDAFIFGTCKQPEPGGVEFAKSIMDDASGLSLRFIRDWDTSNNQQLNRMDVVWAYGSAFPEWACRIAG